MNIQTARNGIAALALVFLASVARAEPEPQPPPAGSFIARLLPNGIQAGINVGLTGSRFSATGEYAAAVEPTPSSSRYWTAPSYGAMIEARWRNGVTLAFSPRLESYGVETREETVSFPDNPFPHTLKASMEVEYTVFPLLLGYGWFPARGHVQIQLGTYVAILDDRSSEWIVDGEPYGNAPKSGFSETQTGWILATEYGLRLGAGELLLGAELQRQSQSAMEGLEGSLKARSGRVSLAYAWTLMQR